MTSSASPDIHQLLDQSKRNTENVIKAAPLGICITDPHGYFEMVNPAYCDFYGYAEEELLGQHFTMLVPDANRETLHDLHDSFIEGEERHELRQEWEVIGKGGKTHTIIAEAARIIGFDGQPRKVTFIVDITQRKRLEQRLQKANERLHYLAHHDELTGLLNRRAGLQRLEQELSRSSRYGSPLSVSMFDLDNFKAINDTYGHGVGDNILQEVTAKVNETLRETDIQIRLGGEEFLVIMPEVDAENARQAMERVRSAVAETTFTQRALTVTLSAGVAGYVEASTTRLLDHADKAMYQAKQSGRNRVVVASSM
ncbi:PAS domain S-box-containing protein/diguanylate cyclase (GGDEF) domain-containing protein [Vreelandella subterranea]|uniref:diguanylate cyclase n=1 Tax=Vreelandella subterranea TaxID=416874 RepID=A0A1H9W934_9GAMM|nr:sensor domain-containing diguanylate cyclase [Halomonas subterranea]SES30334.1 PAS domain S-box-containing protein/diguanylate cyclase (GGDEF) domain-containing protein [Halomonas subterranea]